MELITLSQHELNRIEIIQRVTDKRMTQLDAAFHLKLSTRQVRRLTNRFRIEGVTGLASKKRGKTSNNKLPGSITKKAIELIQHHYEDFGPTLACEKLLESHGIDLSVETVRQLMIEAEIWLPRKQRRSKVYQPRYRRDCFGELIQVDGSDHDWFEGRSNKCTLLVYIDDATSKLMHLKFVESENTFDYFMATCDYIKMHGKPIAFYSDKHTTFRVNKKGATTGTGMTQFGRAMHELNIDIICANSSQAKGRVERANKTLQDRLVKELRLEGITTIEQANTFLPSFIYHYNQRFAKPARNPKDMHRCLSEFDDLDRYMSWQVERTVSYNLTIQYDRIVFIIEPNEFTTELKRQKVTVYDYPDGRLEIRYKGKLLPYTKFDKVRQVKQAQVVSNKRLGAVLELAKQQQAVRSFQRSKSAPQRRGQTNSMFS